MRSKDKELKRDYLQTLPQMGVWQIRNMVNEKVLIGLSLNLPGILNRHRFALQMGGHQNRALQADWHEFGADKFAFEVLDEITPKNDPSFDARAELTALEDLWLDKLQPYGERGYNEKKKGREERLRMIANNRLKADADRFEDDE